MRRILAIALLIAFGSPLVLPALASPTDTQSNLPACCRRNGAHHCTGLMPGATNGPAFKAPPCPIYPSPATPLRLTAAALAAPPAPSAELLKIFAPLASSQSRAHSSVPSSNHKRGPPALLA